MAISLVFIPELSLPEQQDCPSNPPPSHTVVGIKSPNQAVSACLWFALCLAHPVDSDSIDWVVHTYLEIIQSALNMHLVFRFYLVM